MKDRFVAETSRLGLGLALGLGVALGAAGCKQKHDDLAGLPPATEWNAPVAGAVAAPSGVPDDESDPHAGVDMSGGGAVGPVGEGAGEADPHAGVDMAAAGGGAASTGPLGLPPPDPDRVIDPSKHLRGTIAPSAAMSAKIPADAVLYLSVKRIDPTTGEPVGFALATERYESPAFPISFDVTARQQMVDGTGEFDGDVVVTVWWDQDGEATRKDPGDIIGTVKAKIPAKDLKVVLDREVAP